MKYPLALLVNDIHVDKNCIPAFNKNWDEVLEVAKKNNIEDVVIGGDVFTSRASQTLDVLLAVSHAFLKAAKAGIQLTIAEGNHDKVDQECIEGYNHIFSPYKNVNVIDIYEIMQWEGCDIALCIMSYFPEAGSFPDKLLQTRQVLKNRGISPADTILYIHEGVHGALGNMELATECSQDIFDGFKNVLCGHYHNRTAITNTSIEYIGSSRQKDFGEDQDKGYTIFYDDGSFEFIQNQVNERFLNLETTYKKLNSLNLNQINLDNTRVKLKINCTEAEQKLIDKNKLYELGISKIDFNVDKIKKVEIKESDINVKYDQEGLVKEYRQFSDQKNLDADLGVKYLNKIEN